MSKLHRLRVTGHPVFVTSVTYERQPLLLEHIDLLTRAFGSENGSVPPGVMAWVVVPDHIHLLLELGDMDVSGFMQRVKMSFASLWRKRMDLPSGRVWQNRFWDHVIRDQQDLNRHLDYIHYNPVKHGLVSSPFEWRHSSVGRYLERGSIHRIGEGKR